MTDNYYNRIINNELIIWKEEKKSRRDGTLLTVDFNLRTTDTEHIHPSPAWDDTLLSGVYISYAGKLCGFAALREMIISRKVAKTQRLKCTDIDREKYMMQVPSLRDTSLYKTFIVVCFLFHVIQKRVYPLYAIGNIRNINHKE